MPTLQDVAKHAGVSTATVSKVLSNTPYVSKRTRDRVLKAVEEVGYRPNLAARALASGKTHIIAVVFPYIYDGLFQDPLIMSILEGIESVCTDEHYNLLLSTPRVQAGLVDEHYNELIQSGYIEGLIAIDNAEPTSFASVAADLNVPTVILGYHEGDYSVRSDDYLGGRLLMTEVLQREHERIGFISVPDTMNIAIAQRLRGMRQVAGEYGLASDQLPVVYSDFSTQGGGEATDELISRHPDLTAIVSLNDRMAIGAIRHLQQIGRHVPEDISVVGYDNIAMAAISTPPLTTVDQTAVIQGQQAAELLFKRLRGDAPSAVVLPPELIVRESLAARR